MAEKPILFSTPMVQAILEGRKTQTRRVIKPQPDHRHRDIAFEYGKLNEYSRISGVWHVQKQHKCPYGVPGDILWVRETWSRIDDLPYDNYVYRTDYGATEDDSFPPSMFKWKPSIHMPREAARIFLRVTNVRVERVQEITPKDAWEEGCRIGNSFPWEKHIPELQQQCRDILFKSLWDGLNAKRGYGWDINPWVWVISFEREG